MAQSTTKKLGVVALASVVVSSMVGGGIYSLPQNMAAAASVGAVLIAWVITGLGMYFLANSFRILSDVRPDLKAGIYMYGREWLRPLCGLSDRLGLLALPDLRKRGLRRDHHGRS